MFPIIYSINIFHQTISRQSQNDILQDYLWESQIFANVLFTSILSLLRNLQRSQILDSGHSSLSEKMLVLLSQVHLVIQSTPNSKCLTFPYKHKLMTLISISLFILSIILYCNSALLQYYGVVCYLFFVKIKC